MKRLYIFIFLALLSYNALAIDIDSIMNAKANIRENLPRFAATFKAAIGAGNEASTSFEVGLDWYPLRYVGMGLSLELDDNHGNQTLISWLFDNSDDYTYDYDEHRVIRLNLHPTFALRTPIWYFRKDSDWGLMLQCKPGLCISVPRNDTKYVDAISIPQNLPDNGQHILPYERQRWENRGGEWLSWRLLTAVSISNPLGTLSVGWSISNYNIMSCRNNLYYKGKRMEGYDTLSKTNMLFVSLSAFF